MGGGGPRGEGDRIADRPPNHSLLALLAVLAVNLQDHFPPHRPGPTTLPLPIYFRSPSSSTSLEADDDEGHDLPSSRYPCRSLTGRDSIATPPSRE